MADPLALLQTETFDTLFTEGIGLTFTFTVVLLEQDRLLP